MILERQYWFSQVKFSATNSCWNRGRFGFDPFLPSFYGVARLEKSVVMPVKFCYTASRKGCTTSSKKTRKLGFAAYATTLRPGSIISRADITTRWFVGLSMQMPTPAREQVSLDTICSHIAETTRLIMQMRREHLGLALCTSLCWPMQL